MKETYFSSGVIISEPPFEHQEFEKTLVNYVWSANS